MVCTNDIWHGSTFFFFAYGIKKETSGLSACCAHITEVERLDLGTGAGFIPLGQKQRHLQEQSAGLLIEDKIEMIFKCGICL